MRAPRSQFGLRGLEGGAQAPVFQNLQGEALRREASNNKRTLMITLGALGVGSVGLYFLASSGGVPASTPRVFENVAACVAAKVHENGVCETQWNEASRVHDRGAPEFATIAACEAAHGAGKCVHPNTPEDAERAQKYIPVMTGYFFGQTPQGTFKGVPLYSDMSEGPNSFRVAEVQPKEPIESIPGIGRAAGVRPVDPQDSVSEAKDGQAKDKDSDSSRRGSGGRSLVVIPIITPGKASAAAPPASVRPAPAVAPAPASAPASAAPAAANSTSRGGMGAAARSAGVSGSGG